MSRTLLLLSLTGVPLALTGCAPQVAIAVPPNISSEVWTVAVEPPASPDGVPAATPLSLGALLGSAELDRLIGQARSHNSQIGVATARIRQARGLLRTARGSMLPIVGGSAGVSQSRNSNTGNPFDFSESFVGIDVDFDVDLFGGARAGRRAALQRARAAEYNRDAVALVVEGDVARAYVRRSALAERIALLNRNTQLALDLERIIGARVGAGDATRVDLGLQTIQVRQLQTERLRLTEALDRTRTALAVLVGDEAPLFRSDPAPLDSFAQPSLAVMQPALLLARRPDVRAAEHVMLAANGDIAEARAAFMPRISLSARGLVQALSLTGPLSSGSSIGLDLLGPIFDRGRLHGNLEFVSGRQMESVALYRETILIALADTENAMSASLRAGERSVLLAQVVDEARRTARLARLQYLGGEVDLQYVLDAEQLLSASEDAAAVARQEQLEAGIDLFLAMGGAPLSSEPVALLARSR